MKIGRFLINDTEFYGVYRDGIVYDINNDSFQYEYGDLNILTPCIPQKIVCVGLNYKKHAAELNMSLPDEPVIFLKPPSAILQHKGQIVYPEMSNRVDYEAELGVVIGKQCKNVKPEDVSEYILGYLPFNDVTARDLQGKDGQWTRAKGFDTFAPFGPFIETEIPDPDNLDIKAVLNGKVVQSSNTSDMIFNVYELVSFVSRVMTLEAGDIISTGTPSGIGPMNKGDTIEIHIEGMEPLVNYVI